MSRRRRAELPPAALYHRVSTLDQDPTLARDDLRRALAGHGYRIELDVEETGTGAANDRPGLQRVIEAARRSQVRAVFVWKLDRWGRSALDVVTNVRALLDAGVRWIAVTQGLDCKPGGDSVSILMLNVLAAVAEFELNLIRERTAAGLARARQRGAQLGRPRGAKAPTAEQVAELRERGRAWSWAAVAKLLGCSVGQARRAAACRKGGADPAPHSRRSKGAARSPAENGPFRQGDQVRRTAAEVQADAVARADCGVCQRRKGQRCRNKNGGECEPHRERIKAARTWRAGPGKQKAAR